MERDYNLGNAYLLFCCHSYESLIGKLCYLYIEKDLAEKTEETVCIERGTMFCFILVKKRV